MKTPPRSPVNHDVPISTMLPSNGGVLTAAEFITKAQSVSLGILTPIQRAFSSQRASSTSRSTSSTLASAILNRNIKETSAVISGIISLQARSRGRSVRCRMNVFKTVSAAAAKIQAAFRRYRVWKWIHNDDSSSETSDDIGIVQGKKCTRHAVMDQLLGFHSHATKAVSSTLPDTPVVTRAINAASPDSAVIIKAMQLEIKRLQRMISRQGPIIPADPS